MSYISDYIWKVENIFQPARQLYAFQQILSLTKEKTRRTTNLDQLSNNNAYSASNSYKLQPIIL